MELIGIHSSVSETSLEQLEKQTSLANKILVFIFSALEEKALLLKKNNNKNSGGKRTNLEYLVYARG